MKMTQTLTRLKELIVKKKDGTITPDEDIESRNLCKNLDRHEFYYVLGLVLGK